MISAYDAGEMLPQPYESKLAIAAPGSGEGYWSGAPSAAQMQDGTVLLAARIRTPDDRGGRVDIYPSQNGVTFTDELIYSVNKDQMDAESLERPWLMQTKEGKWRLYLSCATTGTKHWRVEMIEADTPDSFDTENRIVVMQEGLDAFGLKDPVIRQVNENNWDSFVAAHPLDDPDATDRIDTWYGHSHDGSHWQWTNKQALSPAKHNNQPDSWTHQAMRATTMWRIGRTSTVAVLFDGRSTADQNFHERTGIATGNEIGNTIGPLEVHRVQPAHSQYGRGSLRYAAFLELNYGRTRGQDRLYFEIENETGAHELRVESRGYL